jgi:hypothetical protein
MQAHDEWDRLDAEEPGLVRYWFEFDLAGTRRLPRLGTFNWTAGRRRTGCSLAVRASRVITAATACDC